MANQDLIELVQNPLFIPGIYNYCDRWCERCQFTSRCIVYAMESHEPQDAASKDVHNRNFWHKLNALFQKTQEIISAWAEDEGIDLCLSPLESLQEDGYDIEQARTNQLSVAAEAYALSVIKWFDEDFAWQEMITDTVVGREESLAETDNLNDALDVIRWYHLFIAAKTIRAIISRYNERDSDSEPPNDSDGSMKVALIAIDRSILAWHSVRTIRPELSRSVALQLTRLERMRKDAEAEFPDARDFVRAGFDEMLPEIIN